MTARSASSATILIAMLAAGCSGDGSLSSLNTSSIDQAATQTAKSDPVCLTLASQIEALNKDGTADRVSKAALKKYKLKPGDLTKADELNKANAEFQSKCSDYPPRPVVATAPITTTTTPAASKAASTTGATPKVATTTPGATTPATPAAPKVAAKKTAPPVPAPKTVATAAPPQAPAATSETPAPTSQTAENPDFAPPQP